jgi:hypothetical protein
MLLIEKWIFIFHYFSIFQELFVWIIIFLVLIFILWPECSVAIWYRREAQESFFILLIFILAILEIYHV